MGMRFSREYILFYYIMILVRDYGLLFPDYYMIGIVKGMVDYSDLAHDSSIFMERSD